MTDLKEHWKQVYETKAPDDVSWFQTRPAISLKLIQATGIGHEDGIIDVGGGASALVDFLLEAGFERLAVLDITASAFERAKQPLGRRADKVQWIEADVTEFHAPQRFNLWHDRAVFHFLTETTARQKYVDALKRTLTPSGHVIIATFAVDGPTKCSGLDVARYNSAAICAELGGEFQLIEQVDETHLTPWKSEQKFSYFRFARNRGALS